jgi:hypothetical protein
VICPSCAGHSQVSDSRKVDNQVVRIRKCDNHHMWKTVEVFYDHDITPPKRKVPDHPSLTPRMNVIARYAAGEMTVDQAASTLGVTKSRVSQLMRTALSQLWLRRP